jgi:epoxyqueuosine reductase
VVAPDALPDAPARLAEWLASGAHGDMDWMAQTAERRADPRALWPLTRSIIMLGMNYGPEENPIAMRARANSGAAEISVYARHRDYHDVIKGRLKTLAQWIVREGRLAARGRLALLLAGMPDKWQGVFLTPPPWPPEFVDSMRRSYLAAGPRFQSLTMVPKPLEFNALGSGAAQWWETMDRKPIVRKMFVGVLILIMVLTAWFIFLG